VIAFSHAIEIERGQARLSPMAAPCRYAIVHPDNGGGYIREPTLHPVA